MASLTTARADLRDDLFVIPRIPLAKRFIDVLVAVAALVATLPLLLLICAAVKMSSPGPVFFRQQRYGLGGLPYTILKFRTMRSDAEEVLERLLAERPDLQSELRTTWKLREDPRLTLIGPFLRKTSLDELPQLLNVLRGDMSLVGPRPRWCEDELAAYGSDRDVLFRVPPGLTGPWQVSGRNHLPEHVRVALDLEYARHRTLTWDLALLLRTVPVLLRPKRSGAF